jgi:acyl-CoA thioester hydrolase
MTYPIRLEIPVAWGEMDAFGHVNNTVFFRYFESARIAYFRELNHGETQTEGFLPIVASTECTFLRPVHFPDTVFSETRVSRIGNSSFTMEHRITSLEQDTVVAEGKAVVVNIDPSTGKGVALNENLRARMEQLGQAAT